MAEIVIGKRAVGVGNPVFVIAEIGINHNGSLPLARRLVDMASEAGCDAVKFQKRTPELCVPPDQRDIMRDTPWGRMRYIDYRYRVEFGEEEYREIDRHCRSRGILWFASCWDEESVDFMRRFEPPCYKLASASLTDLALVRHSRATGCPLILSTGMSTMAEIDAAVRTAGRDNLLLAHTNSSYPCPPEELNLRMIETLRGLYPGLPLGYSGHEQGIAPTLAAVAMGVSFVERHITLDRRMWGSDQTASLEKDDLMRLVAGIREIEKALGDGRKRITPGEQFARKKLRRR